MKQIIHNWFEECQKHYLRIEMPTKFLGPIEHIKEFKISDTEIWFQTDSVCELKISHYKNSNVIVKNDIHILLINDFESMEFVWIEIVNGIKIKKETFFYEDSIKLYGYNFSGDFIEKI